MKKLTEQEDIKTILFVATSADGFAARKNGDEDFLPNEGWYECLELAKSHGHLIWG